MAFVEPKVDKLADLLHSKIHHHLPYAVVRDNVPIFKIEKKTEQELFRVLKKCSDTFNEFPPQQYQCLKDLMSSKYVSKFKFFWLSTPENMLPAGSVLYFSINTRPAIRVLNLFEDKTSDEYLCLDSALVVLYLCLNYLTTPTDEIAKFVRHYDFNFYKFYCNLRTEYTSLHCVEEPKEKDGFEQDRIRKQRSPVKRLNGSSVGVGGGLDDGMGEFKRLKTDSSICSDNESVRGLVLKITRKYYHNINEHILQILDKIVSERRYKNRIQRRNWILDFCKYYMYGKSEITDPEYGIYLKFLKIDCTSSQTETNCAVDSLKQHMNELYANDIEEITGTPMSIQQEEDAVLNSNGELKCAIPVSKITILENIIFTAPKNLEIGDEDVAKVLQDLEFEPHLDKQTVASNLEVESNATIVQDDNLKILSNAAANSSPIKVQPKRMRSRNSSVSSSASSSSSSSESGQVDCAADEPEQECVDREETKMVDQEYNASGEHEEPADMETNDDDDDVKQIENTKKLLRNLSKEQDALDAVKKSPFKQKHYSPPTPTPRFENAPAAADADAELVNEDEYDPTAPNRPMETQEPYVPRYVSPVGTKKMPMDDLLEKDEVNIFEELFDLQEDTEDAADMQAYEEEEEECFFVYDRFKVLEFLNKNVIDPLNLNLDNNFHLQLLYKMYRKYMDCKFIFRHYCDILKKKYKMFIKPTNNLYLILEYYNKDFSILIAVLKKIGIHFNLVKIYE